VAANEPGRRSTVRQAQTTPALRARRGSDRATLPVPPSTTRAYYSGTASKPIEGVLEVIDGRSPDPPRALVLAALMVLVALARRLRPSPHRRSAVPAANASCGPWCGNGSATVTIAQYRYHDLQRRLPTTAGSAGVDARFGDWSPKWDGRLPDSSPPLDTGGATPTPAATLASPGASEYPSPNVTGSVAGSPFILGPDTVVTLAADGAGSFSGTDLNGGGLVKRHLHLRLTGPSPLLSVTSMRAAGLGPSGLA